MKIRFMALMGAVLLSACAADGRRDAAGAPQTIAMSEENLSGTWVLRDPQSAPGYRPLALRFQNGRVALVNGCNKVAAAYRIEGENVIVGNAASTLMACSPDLMETDRLAAKLLKGKMVLKRVPEDTAGVLMEITADQSVYRLRKSR